MLTEQEAGTYFSKDSNHSARENLLLISGKIPKTSVWVIKFITKNQKVWNTKKIQVLRILYEAFSFLIVEKYKPVSQKMS